jgi:glycosyltransferase involved in cell wall biosynthesis
MTSTCYEGFPLSLGEALSMGTPAVVPDHGAMPWISDVPEIGLQFKACDPDDLHRILHQAAAMADEEWQRRSDAARARYEAHFTAERNFAQLMDVYRAALADFEDQR